MQDTTSTSDGRRMRVAMYINKLTGDEPHMVRVRDLSTSGMYLCPLIEPVQASESREFTVEMQLPGEPERIWAGVQVVRRERRGDDVVGYGVRFCRLDEQDRQRIGRFIRDHEGPAKAHH